MAGPAWMSKVSARGAGGGRVGRRARGEAAPWPARGCAHPAPRRPRPKGTASRSRSGAALLPVPQAGAQAPR